MKLKDVTEEMINKVALDAIEAGWSFKEYDINTGMISFIKKVNGERLNVYLTTLTVVTEAALVGKGKTQVYHRKVEYEILLKLFKDPHLRVSGINKTR